MRRYLTMTSLALLLLVVLVACTHEVDVPDVTPDVGVQDEVDFDFGAPDEPVEPVPVDPDADDLDTLEQELDETDVDGVGLEMDAEVEAEAGGGVN